MGLPEVGDYALALLAQTARAVTPDDVQAERLMVPLLAALGLSLLVERVIELMKNISDILPTTPVGRALHKTEALDSSFEALDATVKGAAARDEGENAGEAIRTAMESLEAQSKAATDPAKATEFEMALSAKRAELEALDKQAISSLPEVHPLETMLVEPASDPDEGDALKTFCIQMIAVAFGIVAAHVTKLQLFDTLLASVPGGGHVSPSLDYVLTGLFIGGGSGPAHVLIRFITERKVIVNAEAAAPEDSARAPVAVVPSAARPLFTAASAGASALAIGTVTAEKWVEIPYEGGVDRDLLESVHHRRARPNMVVYHHTAMHSKSTFQDVVRVIKDRADDKGNHWITGYHCVILADGSIHPFCRWDRYGNHAVGYNRTSLGVTFNGNFETRASVPYSNPDGRYGLQRPTAEQLDAGARVTALWISLYDIPVEFTKSLIPHRFVSPKTCPGNQFPETEYKSLVDHYVTAWKSAGEPKDAIDAFRLRPYLYVTEGALAWK